MDNTEIARVFSNLAIMLEMDGANPFRVRAYREAARVIESQAEPVARMSDEAGRLESIRGIGKDLAQKIRDVASGGTTAVYEEMKVKYPLEVVALTEIPGLGPKRAKTLLENLKVRGRDDVERLARAGKLRDLPGFGQTTEQNVIKALERTAQNTGRVLLSGAWPVAESLAEHVKRVPGVVRVEVAGSFRRRRDTIGDLDLLVCGGGVEAVMKAFVTHPGVAEVLGRGDTKSSVRMANGLQVDLRLVPLESFGAAMLYFTGSKEHNIELRKIAIERGMSLNEYGLTRGEELVAGRTEEDVYRALELAWIPPELREARDEIALARAGRMPTLIEQTDLVADLHMHSDRTDGRDTLEVMVRAVRDRGFRYCAVTEHSKSLAMARGFDEARVRQSVDEIAAVRRQVPGIEVLHGLEVDIKVDGSLDLEDDGLALLDWVIVSLHSRLDQPAEVITARVLKALDHPRVMAMAHPTARMIGTREPVRFDVERVLERAAANGVLMEINAQPDRTDLSDVNARLAREKGVGIVIDTDAHSTVQLDFMRYGVFAARRAGLTASDVWNTRPLEEFRKRLRRPGASVGVVKPAAVATKNVTSGAPSSAAATTAKREIAKKPGATREKPKAGSGARGPASVRTTSRGAAKKSARKK